MKFKILFVTVISILGAACDGSSTAPTVSSVTPANEATGVAITSTVTATFDEDMLSTSIDGTSFTLANSSSTAGTVTFDGSRVVTFTPTNNLALMSTYTATLSTGNTDLSGNALASDYVWSFTTADGTWGTAELIETDNVGDTGFPQIAFDSSDNAIAVWYQDDGTRQNIRARRFDGTSGEWEETDEKIDEERDSGDSGDAGRQQIAFDGNGNAIAVWQQYDRTTRLHDIWFNRFDGISWDTAERIGNNSGDARHPQITFDSSGNAIAVWHESPDLFTNDIWASRFDGTSVGWETAEKIETVDGTADLPQIAFDSSGNAIAVWQQDDGTGNKDIWASRFNGTWGTAGLIEDDSGVAENSQIAFDSSGNAIAVWQQDDDIWFNRFDGTTGKWGDTAGLIEDNSGSASFPQIAFDSSGNAIAVWSQYDDTDNINNIWSNRFDGTTWDTAGLIEDNSGSADIDSENPQIAFDSSGNAIAVWYQDDGTGTEGIWVNRFDGTSWGTAEKIDKDRDLGDSGDAQSPQIAFDSSGNAIAVWHQGDVATFDSIWFNRFEYRD